MSIRIPTMAELEEDELRDAYKRGQLAERKRIRAVVQEESLCDWPTQESFKRILEAIGAED